MNLSVPSFDLSGKTALITGGGQNTGAGIARMLAKHGAAVIINDVVADRANAQAEAIRASGGRAIAQIFDVTDLNAVKAGIAAAERALPGSVDILVHNAGKAGTGSLAVEPFAEMAPEHWNAPIDINLYGLLNCAHSVLPGMIRRRWGRVVTISSAAGSYGTAMGVSLYGAGKGAAIAVTRHIAMENAGHGITGNSVALGIVREGDDLKGLGESIPIGRRGNPEDVAALCLYLASPEASWFTGQTVHLNGGAYTS